MSLKDALFRPADKCEWVNAKAIGGFHFRQHAAFSKSIIARAKRVSMGEISNAQRGETSTAATRSGRPAGTKSLLIEDVGDFGIDMVVEKPIHHLNDRGWRLDLLAG